MAGTLSVEIYDWARATYERTLWETGFAEILSCPQEIAPETAELFGSAIAQQLGEKKITKRRKG